jgi:ribose transport system ATP-binding protein
MTPTLSMQGICKSFYGVEVLHKVDFTIEKNEIMGLCGENGAGKSTLMKILAGIYAHEAGEVVFKGNPVRRGATPLEMQHVGISMIHQELNLLSELTVAQNIFLCREPRGGLGLIDFGRMNEEAAALLAKLGEKIDPRRKVYELKIAQKQMVEIAKAISFNVELLVMDEPTSMLTGKETKILFDLIASLSEQGIAVVYISHRLQEISDACHKVTVLRDGYFVATKKVSEVSTHDIASLMVGRELQESKVTDFMGDPDAVMLEVRGVADDMLKGVSFKVRRGEILGFSGLVGAGRTELMEAIFGIQADLGFVTEDRKETGLVLCRDVGENSNYVFWQKGRGFFKPARASGANTKNMIDRLAIRCSSARQLVSNLSGGNQQKVALAKWLVSGAKILVLDEPTRGVDVGARQELYRIIKELAAEGVAIVIVSSDLPEILTICERVIVMHEGKITGELKASELTEDKVMYYATNIQAGE